MMLWFTLALLQADFPDADRLVVKEAAKWSLKGGYSLEGYIPELAFRSGTSGQAVVVCVMADPTRTARCKVVADQPQKRAFGEATAAMGKALVIDPTAGLKSGDLILLQMSYVIRGPMAENGNVTLKVNRVDVTPAAPTKAP